MPSQNTVRREMRQRAMTIVANAGVDDGAGGGSGGGGADDVEDKALSDPMARRLAEFNSLAGKASLHHVKDGHVRLHESTTHAVAGGEQSPRPSPVRRKSVPTVNFGGEQGLVKITSPAPEVRLATHQQNRRTSTLESRAAVPAPKHEPEPAPEPPGQRPRVPSHNTVCRDLRQRAMTIVMNAGVNDGGGGGDGGGGDGGGGVADAEEEALSDPMARRLAEFTSLAGKAVRRKSVPTVNFGGEQGLVQIPSPAPEAQLPTHQQSRRTPTLESRAAVPAPEPEPELELNKMVATTSMQAVQYGRPSPSSPTAAAHTKQAAETERGTERHTERGHREAVPQPYAEHKATPGPNGRAASAAAISAELAQMESMEKDRLQQNLSFLQDTERSRLDEENRIIEKSHTWRERQSKAETRYNKAIARVAAKGEPVTSKATDLVQPSSPRGWVVAGDTRSSVETEALAAGLAAEQQRVTALENEVAEMRTAWEEERVMAAAERAALEQALAAQGVSHGSGESPDVTRADGGDSGSRHSPTVSGPLQVGVDDISAMAQQPKVPVPPRSPAKRPHARAGRSRKGGAARPQTAFGRRQYRQPSAKGSRPSSARATRPTSRPSKREVSSARQRPHRPDDVMRSDTARAILEEWIRADKIIHADRRELRTNLPADNRQTIGPCEDDGAVCHQAVVARRCARRRSYRRLCVKLVEALNADALGAVHRCERERAIKLLLEARRVLANDCFGKTPSAEMQEHSQHTGEVESKDSKAVSNRLDDGRNLHEWVRLHSCTLNNLAIAHRERARANKTSSLDPKSARALAKVNADAKAMVKAPSAETCELQP
eukprot:COSAG03_NODE_2254_length_2954_cov_2.440630_1_plen_831_part_01